MLFVLFGFAAFLLLLVAVGVTIYYASRFGSTPVRLVDEVSFAPNRPGIRQ